MNRAPCPRTADPRHAILNSQLAKNNPKCPTPFAHNRPHVKNQKIYTKHASDILSVMTAKERNFKAANTRRKRAASGLLTPAELEENADRPLNERERLYVQGRAQGMGHVAAQRMAGYSATSSKAESIFLSRPAIRAALEVEQAKYRDQCKFKRDDVLNGLSEAIEQAKIQADPMGQIAGWREIAKICGFYAPETKKIELGGSAQRLLAKFEQLSDQELMEIAQGEVIEAEFTDVTHRKALT